MTQKKPLADESHSGYFNEGTAMNHTKRQTLGLNGLLPAKIETLDTQKKRCLHVLRSKSSMLEKYVFMAQLRTSNVRLFYKIVMDELEELAPIIYTPTVGTACLEYSTIYPFLAAPGVPDGLFLTKSDLPTLTETIKNYQSQLEPQIAVISDGSRILGLGDLGSNGMGIPIGKLQLYVACAGIDPRRTLPILLDLGTNNEKLLNDEFYIGLSQKRPDDEEFYETVDKVVQTLVTVYPNILVQFEDWSSEHAFGLLERYKSKILCFNDDIQGTGAVILSGIINAIRKVQNEDSVPPKDHRILFYGAGSAAIGVAHQIQDYFQFEHKMPEEEAKKLFWIVDSKGLVTKTRGDKLAEHKIYYAREDEGKEYRELIDIVDYVKPTILIGLSSTSGAFNKQVLNRMSQLNQQPIIFPLSNPATQAECTFEQAMIETENRVIFASGTAFPAYTIPSTNQVKYPGQGNNMYIFPGLGLGAILSRPNHITDRMIYATAKALADSLTTEEINQGWLYPSLKRIRDVSATIAVAVYKEAVDAHLASLPKVDNIQDYVISNMWSPIDDHYGSLDTKSNIHANLVIAKDARSGKQIKLEYANKKITGNGSFGVVYQTRLVETNEEAAIKKVLQDRRFKNRELQIMRLVDHPNVCQLKSYFYNQVENKEDEVYLNLVMEYIPDTLYKATRQYAKSKVNMPMLLVQLYMYQILRSLAYIHCLGICHRDIKPQNVLLNPITGVCKMCDFGSAKILVPGEPNVSYICSRYYRAPELIFGATNYTLSIDIWSAGCVMAELILGQPFFPGDSGIDQLVEIIKILGTPDRTEIAAMNANYVEHRFPQIKRQSLSNIFTTATPEAVDLLERMLQYHPQRRISPIEALCHPFFDAIRDPNTKLSEDRILPPVLNFTREELSIRPDLIRRLVPPHAERELLSRGIDIHNFDPIPLEQMKISPSAI
ncbi:hypothetical protein G6F27_005866 [Rhizopus arrhizus]|nr:hypothetical protein G6F27_005866 [Rhizopus arrhizus]